MKDVKGLIVAQFFLLTYLLDLIILFVGDITEAHIITQFSFLLAVITSFFFLIIYSKNKIQGLYSSGVGIVLFFVCFVIASFIYDVSYDGQTYHLQTVYDLKTGWNPIKDTLQNTGQNIFIQHYAKAYEQFSYSLYLITKNVEGCKSVNCLLLISSFLIVNKTLDRYFTGLSNRYKFIFSFLISCNPISVHQLFTFYVDGQVASLIVILLSSIFLYLKDQEQALPVIISSGIILSNMKFTGLIYSIIFLGSGLTFLIFQRKRVIQYLFASTIIIVVSIFIVGYNPYYRNITEHGNIFYPLLGSDKVNIMGGVNAPLSFAKKSNIIKLLEADFSNSRNVHGQSVMSEPSLKIPFSFKISEWTVFKSHDVRMGGFGPLWSGILLIAILGIGIGFKNNVPGRKYYLLMICVIFLSVLIIPEGWYARYAPQFWLIPLIILFYLMQIKKRFAQIILKTGLIIMSVNLLGTWCVSLTSDIVISREVDSELNWIRKMRSPVYVAVNQFISNKFRVDQKHIAYMELENKEDVIIKDFKILTIQNSNTAIYYQGELLYKPTFIFKLLNKYAKM